MRFELDMFRASHSPLTRNSHGSYVVIRVSWVHCAFRVLGLSRDAKYLYPRSRLWVIERDPHMQL